MDDYSYPAHLSGVPRKKPDRMIPILIGVIIILAFIVIWLGITLALALTGVPQRGPLAELVGLDQGSRPAQGLQAAPATEGSPTAAPLPTLAETSASALLPASDPSPTTAPAGLCGQTGSLTILFTGADFAGGVWPEGADAVRVIKVNYDTRKIAVIAFPRDLWVRTSSLSEQGVAETRLGLAYHYKKEAAAGAEKQQITAATTAVGQALYDNFGLATQHYFTLQMSNVAEMVDTLGGVEVIAPETFVSDRGVTFTAGRQVLDGPLALEYVRTFEPGGDAQRLLRQNQFIWGLQEKFRDPALLARLPALIEQFERVVVTDLSPAQMAALACAAGQTPVERIGLFRIDASLAAPAAVGQKTPALQADPALVKARLREWLEE